MSDIIFIGNPIRFEQTQYLLDLYPGAAVAYSLQQLRTGVTNVVRVARSSDNAELNFTASQITDGTLTSWVGAGNNGFVRNWFDQSLNSRHLSQPTRANQFQILSNGALILNDGGKPAVLSTSSGTMTISSPLSLANHSVFTAVSTSVPITSTMTSQSLWRGEFPTQNNFFLGGNVTINQDNERLTWLTVPNNSFGVVHNLSDYPLGSYLVTAIWNGTSPSIYMNQNIQTLANFFSGGFSSVNYPDNFVRISGNSSGAQGFNGKISEFVLYPSAQTANRAAIEANMNSRQGIY
jgi:hypothetical protein